MLLVVCLLNERLQFLIIFIRRCCPRTRAGEGSYCSPTLGSNEIEWPWSCTGSDDGCRFPFLSRNWETIGFFAHKYRHVSVEQKFELGTHVSPMSRRTYDQTISILISYVQ